MEITSYLLGKKASGGGSQGMKVIVVQTLPQTGVEGTLYLVPKSSTKNKDIFDEYIYVEKDWEHIGSTDIDLSNYVDMTSVQTISGKKTFTTLPESSVVPSSNNQLSNKKYVDDSSAGKQDLIDSSNKLDADLVDDTNSTHKFFSGDSSDLLHYKGHVASEGDLPSLGQPSYPTPSSNELNASLSYLEGSFKLSQYTFNDIYNQNVVISARNNNTYYVGISSGGSNYVGIGYNNADAVKIKITGTDYRSGMWYVIGGVSIDASESEPVNLNFYKRGYDDNIYYYDDPNDNTRKEFADSTTTSLTLTSPMVLSIVNRFSLLTNSTLKYTSNLANVLGHTDDWINSSIKGETLVTTSPNSETYRYANGYKFLGPSEVNTLTLVFGGTTTELNDTYTVGDNYDIYRRNENTQWDKFSKQLDLTTISGFNDSTTQVLKSVNGTIQWVDE